MAELAEGAAWLQSLADAGHDDQTIAAMKEQKRKAAEDLGYTQTQIDDFFGDTKIPPPETGANLVKENLRRNGDWRNRARMAEGDSWYQMWRAGNDQSAVTLQFHPPEYLAPENSSFMGRILYSVGQMQGDLIPGIVGFTLAAPQGAAVGGAVTAPSGPGALAGATVGAAVAGGAGAGVLTGAMRQSALEYWDTDENATGWDIAESTWNVIYSAGKEGLVGAATGGAGKKAFDVGKTVLPAVLPAVRTGEVLAMASAGTATSAAVEGRMPTQEDFTLATALTAAVPFGGHLVTVVGARARPVLTESGKFVQDTVKKQWAETGINPFDMGKVAATDPTVRQALQSRDANGQVITTALNHLRPSEPEPYAKPAEEVIPPSTEPAVLENLDPITSAGKPGPESGLALAASATPEQLTAVAGAADNFDAPITPEQTAALVEYGKRYTNEDGSVDIEAVLIAYVDGTAKADVFRANGRQFDRLSPRTQRLLEQAGDTLDREGGYKPPPGGGDGGEPPLPPGGDGTPPGEPQKAIGGPKKDRPLAELNKEIGKAFAPVEKLTWKERKAAFFRRLRGEWREFAILSETDKRFSWGGENLGIEGWMQWASDADTRTDVRLNHMGFKWGLDETNQPALILDPSVPAFNKVLEKVPEADYATFINYLQAKDNLNRAKLGLKTTVDPLTAAEFLRVLPKAKQKEFKVFAKEIRKVFDSSLNEMRDSGVRSQSQIDQMKMTHPDWFPQMVAIMFWDTRPTNKRGLKNLFNAARGHENVIYDPVFEMMRILSNRSRIASANIARKAAVAGLTQKFGDTSEVVSTPVKTAAHADDGIVLNNETGDIIPNNANFWNVKGNEIPYYDDGVLKVYRVPKFEGAEEFVRVLTNSSTFERAATLRVLALSTELLRTGATGTTAFIARQLERDVVTNFALVKNGGIPFVNTATGVFDAIGYIAGHKFYKDPSQNPHYMKWLDYMVNGGGNASIAALYHDVLVQNRRNMRAPDGYHVRAMANSFLTVVDAAQEMYRISDTISRIGGAYTSGKGKVGTMRAVKEAKDKFGDFSQKSRNPIINFLVTMAPFVRAWQRAGIDANLQAFRESGTSKGQALVVAKLGLAITMPVILSELAWEWYETRYADQIPEAQKWSNQPHEMTDRVIGIPHMDTHGNVSAISIALPQGLGEVFGGGARRFMRWYKENDPRAFNDWASNVMNGFMGAEPMLSNPLIKTFNEGKTGVNQDSGRPIIPLRVMDRSGYNQVYPWSSELGKKLSRWLGPPGVDIVDFSPISFDRIVSNFSGQSGRDLLKLFDKAAGRKNALPTDITETPFAGSFFARHPSFNAQPIKDFYAEADKWKTAMANIRRAEEIGDPVDLARIEQSGDLDVRMGKAIDTMSNMRSAVYDIYEIEDMPAQDKRQAIDIIMAEMISLSREVLSDINVTRGMWDEDEAATDAKKHP